MLRPMHAIARPPPQHSRKRVILIDTIPQPHTLAANGPVPSYPARPCIPAHSSRTHPPGGREGPSTSRPQTRRSRAAAWGGCSRNSAAVCRGFRGKICAVCEGWNHFRQKSKGHSHTTRKRSMRLRFRLVRGKSVPYGSMEDLSELKVKFSHDSAI